MVHTQANDYNNLTKFQGNSICFLPTARCS